MYEAIEAYAAEFDNLRGTLAVQHGASIDGIRSGVQVSPALLEIATPSPRAAAMVGPSVETDW